MGPVEIDGTDAKHPVPFKDGYPTVDDCYNTSHDFAVKCKFANGIEMIVDSRSENGVLFEGTKGRIFVDRGKITGKPIEENWDEGKFGPDDLHATLQGQAASKATRTTSTAASAKAACRCRMSSPMSRR